ncbi:MAG: hypothetical protein EBR12_05220 [Proteobacteria bacterium]|nr:hypothetical protein [Pseudomonadota bacterium]
MCVPGIKNIEILPLCYLPHAGGYLPDLAIRLKRKKMYQDYMKMKRSGSFICIFIFSDFMGKGRMRCQK